MKAAEAIGLGGGVTAAAPVGEPSLSELGLLGEYELLTKLGKGGMGTVYKARQTRLGKIVALKVLARERTRDPRAVARFENEMKAVGQLSHPNIVQALDARDIDGTTVLVMEYLDGLDLSKLVQRAGALPIADACELIRQTAVGLQYIDENHLVHRDVKPSNLMLTPQGQVKILDLGLALLGSQQTPAKELSLNGCVMGTPDYIAPEQADDSHCVDIRADIYSLGCTLYHLLTGSAPFSGPDYKTPLNKVVGHARDKVSTVKVLRADIPDELSRIVERMMAKAPAARFATPAEVAAALSPFATGCDLAGLSATPVLPRQAPADAAPARLPLPSSPPWWCRRSTRIAAAGAPPLLVLLG
jgi:serine/threonine protein kinase